MTRVDLCALFIESVRLGVDHKNLVRRTGFCGSEMLIEMHGNEDR